MRDFCNPKEERISEIAIPNLMDPGAKGVTIGLWGFLDVVFARAP
jgi:hypothetical protein